MIENKMKKIKGGSFTGERALFFEKNAHISESVFFDGESPLKESENIILEKTKFEWKYPLWYSKNIEARDCFLSETARSGIWYTHNISFTDSEIRAPKTFRRSSGITLKNVKMPNALETMWGCSDIVLDNVYIRGDYFCMNCENIKAQNLVIDGNYAFDGAKNIEIRNSRLNTKDSFWNCKNVTVYDSVILGEYLGWNSKNVTLINCTVESNQGMCYMQNLKMVNCKSVNTDLAFEYSTVDVEIDSICSVKNPISGRISAGNIDEIIMENNRVDTSLTDILVKGEKQKYV